jgi:hypothetical protein
MPTMKYIAFLVALLAGATVATAQQTDTIAALSPDAQRAVSAYRTAVIAAEAGGKGTLEQAFTALATVRDILLQDGTLAKLSDADYTRLVSLLRGAIINRRGTEFVQPDVNFYAQLASAKGDAADKAFFSTLKGTYPESLWPIYVQAQNGTSCTRFGSLSLVNGYATWLQVQQSHADRYTIPVEDEIDAVLLELSDGSCACGTLADVEKELTAFNTRFPQASIRPDLEGRLADIRKGTSGIEASCRE